MTDEEMAEEYKVDYGIDLCCLCRECEIENINPCQHKKDAMYGYKDGFLAGHKAGRPQWHDLRKDPNDLPNLDKTDMSDYVITDRGVGYYNGRVKSWYIQNEYILSNDVIAWCEIPTFYKEIE